MKSASTILYVEDNHENRLLVKRVLQAEGHKVLEASSAAHALEILDVEIPDLVLVDINMPEMDGFTLTNRLKELPAMHGIPIVALTANVMKGDRERTLAAGCDGYIQKPIDVDDLPDQVNHFLALKR